MEMKSKGKVLLFHCARYNNLTNIVAMGLWGIADYLTSAGYTVNIVHTMVEELYYGNFDVKRYLDSDVKRYTAWLYFLYFLAEEFEDCNSGK